MAVQHQYDDDEQSSPEEPFIIDLVPELKRRIRAAAAENGLSVQEYLERLLDQTVPGEKTATQRPRRPLNREAVERLLQHHEERQRAHAGEEFSDSVELLRQAREERTRELEQR
jgi:hypothetical protein